MRIGIKLILILSLLAISCTVNKEKTTNKIDFKKPVPEYLPYFPFKLDLKIKYQTLPTHDCDSGKWSKIGLYCDTTQRDDLLSKTATNLNEYRDENIPIETIQDF